MTVSRRKSIHSVKISRRFFPAGRPSNPTLTKLIDVLVSKLVRASNAFTKSLSSILDVLGSKTIRTGLTLSDSSRIRSNTDNMACFSFCCVAVIDFLPKRGCGFVIASISSWIFLAETPGGNSVTTNCH